MTTGRPTAGNQPPGQKGGPSSSGRLVYSVPEAGRLLGLSRNAAYAAAQRGEIPVIRIGRRLLVPKVPFHRKVELVGTGTGPGESKACTSERWRSSPLRAKGGKRDCQ